MYSQNQNIASKPQCIIQTQHIASESQCIHAQNIASDIMQWFANVTHGLSLQVAMHHQLLLYSSSKLMNKLRQNQGIQDCAFKIKNHLPRYQTLVSDTSSALPTSLRLVRVCYIRVTLCLSDKFCVFQVFNKLPIRMRETRVFSRYSIGR